MEKTLDDLALILKDFDKEFLKMMDIDSLNKPFKRVMYEVKKISSYWHDSIKYQREIFNLSKHLRDLHPDEEAESDLSQAEIDFVDLHVTLMPILETVIEKLRNECNLWRNFRCNTTEETDPSTLAQIEKAEQRAWNTVGNTLSNSEVGEFTFTLYHFSHHIAPKTVQTLQYQNKRLSEIHLNYMCNHPSYNLIEAH